MTTPATAPAPRKTTHRRLRLAHRQHEATAGDDAGWPRALFDRLFEAWAERAHRIWTDRGWCGSRNAPYL